MADNKSLNKKNSQASKVSNKTNKKTSPSTKARSKKKSSKGKTKKTLKWIGLGALLLFLAAIVIGIGYVIAVIKNTPPIDVEKITSTHQIASFVDRDGKYMDKLNSKEDRTPLKSNQIPQNLKNAIVSIEDERFYEHNGIDIKRILGAVYRDAIYLLTGKGGLQGASTLTQQLVKNTVLTNQQTIERKISEMYLSIELEKLLSKDEIVTAYLNNFPVGGIAYGAEAGAQLYFDKHARDLNLIECAYLAGVTQATNTYSAYNPANKKDPSVYIKRTKLVLGKMLEHNYINKDEYDKAINDLDSGKLKFKQAKTNYRLQYESFIYPALDQVKRDLKAKYKYSDTEIDNLISSGGLVIHTTMDRNIQNSAQSILDNFKNFGGIHGGDKVNSDGTPLLQASATITDYKTGEVVALIGGRGKQTAKSLNRAYSDLRSIGSTTKPLTAYGPAIDQKVMTAASTINDAPLSPELVKKYNNYNPKNSGSFHGLITAREALRISSNVGAVQTVDAVGVKTGISYGEKFGLKYSPASQGISTVALGQFANASNDPDGGNTFIMASAIGTFGNGGVYIEPRLYTEVVDSTGKTILESSEITKKILTPQAAYIVYDMMKGPLTYNAQRAKFGSMPVAGKTGTSTDNKDYWFAGLTPHYSGAVWVGYDKQNKIYGGGSGVTASNLWGLIMKEANAGLSTADISKPSGIVSLEVCKKSGKLPTQACRNAHDVYTEIFIDGTEPTGYCEVHVNTFVPENKPVEPTAPETNEDKPVVPEGTTPENNAENNAENNTGNNTDPNQEVDENTQNKIPTPPSTPGTTSGSTRAALPNSNVPAPPNVNVPTSTNPKVPANANAKVNN